MKIIEGSLAVIRAILCSFILVAVSAAQSEQFVGSRPLSDAADRLQSVWRRAVTYEEPVWQHPSDSSIEGDPLRLSVSPRFRALSIPATALQSRGRADGAAHLKTLVNAFNAGNAPLGFGVLESAWGLHIVPLRNQDARGVEGPAPSLLDSYVVVASDKRRPMGHVEALAQALTSRSGVRVESGSGALGLGVDQLYLQSDSSPTFEWGTAGAVKARDALLELFSKSATTLSWRFNCQPAASDAPAFCVLNVDPIRVQTRDSEGKLSMTVLAFDRCSQCKRLMLPRSKP